MVSKCRIDNKKAQIKIQQMAFMLLAVTLFIVLVLMFVLMFKTGGLKNEATQLAENNAILLVTKLANSPEFSCGEVFDYGTAVCIDADKVMALNKNKELYKDFWGKDTNIEIRKIYPSANGNTVCTFSNYPNCGVLRINYRNVSGAYTQNFITLCRKDSLEGESYDKCDLALLMVGYKPVG